MARAYLWVKSSVVGKDISVLHGEIPTKLFHSDLFRNRLWQSISKRHITNPEKRTILNKTSRHFTVVRITWRRSWHIGYIARLSPSSLPIYKCIRAYIIA